MHHLVQDLSHESYQLEHYSISSISNQKLHECITKMGQRLYYFCMSCCPGST